MIKLMRTVNHLLEEGEDLVLATIQERFDEVLSVLLVAECLVLGDSANAELPGGAKPEVMG